MAVVCRVASTEPSPVVMDIDVANLYHLTGEPSRSLNEEGGVPLALYYKSREAQESLLPLLAYLNNFWERD